MLLNEKVRNIAIIAHVDHGKTTLVDEMLRQTGIFRSNEKKIDRVMDSGDIERERGITILSKNTAIHYKGIKINIVDTPGHADFGGEVERVLKMVDGVVLIVDAFEGPMPQTKFVLEQALELSLPVVVCINKMDRVDQRAHDVVDEVLELFLELEASEAHFDSPFVFASAREGKASFTPNELEDNLQPLFDTIIKHIPAPKGDNNKPLKLLISAIDYNEYVGRIGIGKVAEGTVSLHDQVMIVNYLDTNKKEKAEITNLLEFDGLKRKAIQTAEAGDIVAIAGLSNIIIGDTICSTEDIEALPFQAISEPTISMDFLVNDSPFAGIEGEFVTTRQVRQRLFNELNKDVSLRVEETDVTDTFIVSGRGELHLAILIETMRREGYEFQVSKPEVLIKEIEGKKYEPIEKVIIDTPEIYAGAVFEEMGKRKGEMVDLHHPREGINRITFSIPTRGLIGYHSRFLTITHGEGVMNTEFLGYEPYKGDIVSREQGSIVASDTGTTSLYGLVNANERGELIVKDGIKVYEGMVVGIHSRKNDIEINVCKQKQLTNMRAAGSDEALRLPPVLDISLETALELIHEDELLEITPKNIRIRKKILTATGRKRAERK